MSIVMPVLVCTAVRFTAEGYAGSPSHAAKNKSDLNQEGRRREIGVWQ